MVQKIVQDAANKVSKTVSTEIEEVHGGYWEKRYDIAKTLLTLNTSILVLQVTFYKEIITFFNSVNATYIIIASWVTIFLSLICTIACIKSSLGISAHKLRLFYALQFSSEEAFSANLTGKELAEDLAKKTYETSNEVFKKILEHDKNANRSIKFSFYLLAISLALLMAFGVTNIYSSKKENQPNKLINRTENTSVLN